MSDRQALIEAIREHPDDDTPRLILADWYEENGDAARGEFVRAQCELARLDPASDRYPELHVRQLQIRAEHEREWLGEWADKLVRWEFRRGMLDEVTICPEPYCAAGAELFAEHPIWRVAFVDDAGESLAPKAISDVLSQSHSRLLRAIDAAACKPGEYAAAMFAGEIHTNSWLSKLARAERLTNLRELSLFGGTRSGRDDIELEAWQRFCAADHLRGVRHLDLSNLYDYHGNGSIWEPVFRELAGAVFAPELRSLRLEGCYVSSDALLHLTRSRRFTKLRTLEVGGAVIHVDVAPVLPELLDPRALPALDSLCIPSGRHLAPVMDHLGWSRFARIAFSGTDDHTVRDVAVHAPIWRAFFRSPHPRPTAFSVREPGYYDLAATGYWDELVGASWLGGLRELEIRLYEQSCAPLFERAHEGLPRLHTLSLNASTELLERLATWPGLANLVLLQLSDSHHAIDPAAAIKLFTSPHLTPRLSRLRANALCRSLEAVAALADCPALVGVRHLDFAFNELTQERAQALAASPYLRNLRSLHTWSEWGGDSNSDGPARAWLALADPAALPQLRDVVVGSGTAEIVQEELRARFGPRLRVFSDC